jgi:4-amino-4-deoxy-L-arabinose transferase-like glycosyltransferase
VLFQAVIDSGTCLVVYAMAREIAPRFALPSAVAATINPTQIVLSGFVYTDTPFTFFAALSLLGAIRWLRKPTWPAALLVGAGLGAATLFRSVGGPAALFVLLFLLITIAIRRPVHPRLIAQLAVAGVIFAAAIAPVMLRNFSGYGAFALTAQGGMHLSRYVVPLIREAHDGTPWQSGYADTEARKDARFGPADPNPFEESRRYTTVAMDEWRKLGPVATIKAWMFGAVINLGTPAIILSPPVAQLPRTGFYGTHGRSMIDKMWTFLFRSDNALYAWVLLMGILGVAAVRLIQLCGLVALVTTDGRTAIALLLVGWCLFILAVNGPVASPKYRLPIEPVLMVLTGAGYRLLSPRLRRGGAFIPRPTP